jgi:hypothetical protein
MNWNDGSFGKKNLIIPNGPSVLRPDRLRAERRLPSPFPPAAAA